MLSSLFARRYLFSRKSHSVINVISVVSFFAVSVPVAAMVILLSVFNGFEELVRSMYTDFDPDVMVLPASGRTFEASDALSEKLAATEGVARWSYIVEESVMVEYRGGQSIATIRGVDSLYDQVIPIQKMVRHGEYAPCFGDIDQALVGESLAFGLGVSTNLYEYITFYAPRRGGISSILQIDPYRSALAMPSGTFALDAETDGKYIIVPLDMARRLMDYPGAATGVAVKLSPGVDAAKAARSIKATLGEEFKALTRYEQKASLYQIMRYEKWGIFLIIGLVLVIASFSVVGSLVMLIIDKRDDMRTIVTMGGSVGLLRKIFRREGILICGGGAILGMVTGVAVCLVQQHFGLVTIPGSTFLVDSYPVVLQAGDMLAVAATFAVVSYAIVNFTVVNMIPRSAIRL